MDAIEQALFFNTQSVINERIRLGLKSFVGLNSLVDAPSLVQPQVYIKAIIANSRVETYCFNCNDAAARCPDWFTLLVQRAMRVGSWQSVEILDNSSNLTASQKRQKVILVRQKRNVEHAKAFIKLYEEQTITCEETGISFSCRLPVPLALNLDFVNPLAFFSNVEKVILQYSKSGIRLEQELEPQVLAGMLLTVLKHKSLLVCKDFVKANLFLQHAHRETLSYAVRFYFSAKSTLGMPALSTHLQDSATIRDLLAESGLSDLEKRQHQAESLILNYIKACKGESTEKEPSRSAFIAPKQAKVKIYSDPVRQQHKDIQGKEKSAELLLTKLQASINASGSVGHSLLLSIIKRSIKMLSFMSEKARTDLASKILDTFPTNEDAHALSQIFATIKQDAIESDLFSLTQEITKSTESQGKTEIKKLKFDFLSKLKAGGINHE